MILSALLLRSQDILPIAGCVIGLCAGIYLFFNGFRRLQRRHVILDTPVSKIRSASLGMVKLSGLAVGPYTVVAPITERPCYYYRSVVWEWKRNGRKNEWVKVAAECMHVPFFLDDNTGKVMVDPRGAELDLHRDFQQEFSDSLFTAKEEVPPSVRMLLLRHGVCTTNKIKVEEFCIKPKTSLFVLGTIDENPGIELTPQPIPDEKHHTLTLDLPLSLPPSQSDPGSTDLSLVTTSGDPAPVEERSVSERLFGGNLHQSGFAGSAFDKLMREESIHAASTQVLRLSPDTPPPNVADMTQQQKIAAALMRAGVSNPAAWAEAEVTDSAVTTNPGANGSSAGGQLTPVEGFDPRPPVVLKKGKSNSTFLISARSQRKLDRSLGWKCTLMIWGGPALSLLCLYGLLALTHSL